MILKLTDEQKSSVQFLPEPKLKLKDRYLSERNKFWKENASTNPEIIKKEHKQVMVFTNLKFENNNTHTLNVSSVDYKDTVFKSHAHQNPSLRYEIPDYKTIHVRIIPKTADGYFIFDTSNIGSIGFIGDIVYKENRDFNMDNMSQMAFQIINKHFDQLNKFNNPQFNSINITNDDCIFLFTVTLNITKQVAKRFITQKKITNLQVIEIEKALGDFKPQNKSVEYILDNHLLML